MHGYTSLWNINVRKLESLVYWDTVCSSCQRQDVQQAATVVTEARFHTPSLQDWRIPNRYSTTSTRWQQGSTHLHFRIDEYQTGIAPLQHASCDWLKIVLVQRRCFALVSLFFVAEYAYSQSFCEFFTVANVNSIFITETTPFSNCFQQLSLAYLLL